MQLVQTRKPSMLSSYRLQKRTSETLIHAVMILIAAAMLLPFILVISASFTTNADLTIIGYKIIPDRPSTEAYSYLFKSPASLLRGYGVTLFVTISGTT